MKIILCIPIIKLSQLPSNSPHHSSYYTASDSLSESEPGNHQDIIPRNEPQGNQQQSTQADLGNLQQINQIIPEQEVHEIELVHARTSNQEPPIHYNWRNSLSPRLDNDTINIEDPDPVTMRRYKYLINGEIYQKVKADKVEERIVLIVTHERMLITLEKIWQCRGKLLDDPKMKDLCLSFALYRLLRCRFSGYSLPDASIPKSLRLVVENILSIPRQSGVNEQVRSAQEEENDSNQQDRGAKPEPEEGVEERVFRITSAELAFLNDFMYSRFPIIFWTEFGFIISALIYIAVMTTTFWTGITIAHRYNPRNDNYTHVVLGINVDAFITYGLLTFIVVKETWEIIIYLFSDWTKIVLISWYVRRSCSPNCFLFRLICNWSVVPQWHGKIDQYNFLEAFNYMPPVCNLAYYISLGILPKKTHGVQNHGKIEVPKEVKKAIVKSLWSTNLDGRQLPNQIPSLGKNNLSAVICQMCELYTCSHIILVWHIATSLCEIELCQHYNIYLQDSELPSLWSSIRSFFSRFKNLSCCDSQSFLVKTERLDSKLRENFTAANSLSRYCAHLLINQPDLLPAHIFVAEEVFQNTVREARKTLEGCDTLQSIYKRLMKEGEQENMSEEDETIVRLGAKLGKELIKTLDEAARWKALAEVWADLLVYMAPSSDVKAHGRCLATGGELITHVWVLLSHAGILKNSRKDKGEIIDDEEDIDL